MCAKGKIIKYVESRRFEFRQKRRAAHIQSVMAEVEEITRRITELESVPTARNIIECFGLRQQVVNKILGMTSLP